MQFQLNNQFTEMNFAVEEGKVLIRKITFFGKDYVNNPKGDDLSVIMLTGGRYPSKTFGRCTVVGEVLEYVSHELTREGNKQTLCIEEKNELMRVKTYFLLMDESAVVRSWKEIENISESDFDLEVASLLTLTNIMTFGNEPIKKTRESDSKYNVEYSSILSFDDDGVPSSGLPYLWKAHNTWCSEAVFERVDLATEGLRGIGTFKCSGKIPVTNNGSHSTCRYLPLGILEKISYGYFMFEIKPSGSWTYSLEAGSRDRNDSALRLIVSNKTLWENGWYKTVRVGETYQTDEVKYVGAETLDGLAEHFTIFRRDKRMKFPIDPTEYVIYNNFQQNTYDHPTAETDVLNMEHAKACGADYYVVDAGWHDDNYPMEGSTVNISPTQKIGEWEEYKDSYPNGFQETIDRTRKLGMKFGLWVELQSIGYFCKKKDILPEECFFHINGHRPISNSRYQLNYANEKTRAWATGIIDKIVTKYNPDYIKIDYNQTAFGNDTTEGSITEGLAEHARAYNKWFVEIQEKYPEVLFESCASGGMNIDPSKAEITNVFSITDAGSYYMYPYILANVTLATLMEQNGVWNMPMRRLLYPSCEWNKDWITTDEEVIMNAVNSLYGVMHLSSRLDKISDRQRELVLEGNEYYRSLAEVKKKAVPVYPSGFTMLDDQVVYVAMKTDEKLYLSVYNLSDKTVEVTKNLSRYKVNHANIAYPRSVNVKYNLWKGVFVCEMPPMSARAFEFTLKTK